MSKFVKLKELCIKITDGSHYSPLEDSNGNYPMLSVKDMNQDYFDYSNCKYIGEEDYTKLVKADCKPLLNDVLIAKDGSYLKYIHVVEKEKEQAILSSIGIIRPNLKKVSPYFLKYYLQMDTIKKQVGKKYVSGTALPRIILKAFGEIEIIEKELWEQENIINLLVKLDKKIELNNKINQELENLAKTLYNYWFVQFDFPNEEGKPYKLSGGTLVYDEVLKREIPEGWKVNNFQELGEIIAGGTPSTSNPDYYCDDGIAWITPYDLANTSNKYIEHGERDISELGLKESSAKLMTKGSVLISTRAPIGYIAIALNDVSTNQGFKSVVPKPEYGSEYVYYTVKSNIKAIEQLGSGTTFMEVSKDSISKFNLLFPPQPLIDKFNRNMKSISEKMMLIESENQELVKLRDWLLPMLMNGQVTFKE